MKKKDPKPKQRSLRSFTALVRQKDCPVCNLPPKALQQIIGRNRKSFPVATVVEWLAAEYGITITVAHLMNHARGAHDTRRARAR